MPMENVADKIFEAEKSRMNPGDPVEVKRKCPFEPNFMAVMVHILLVIIMCSLKSNLEMKTEITECETCYTLCSPEVFKQSCSHYCKALCDDKNMKQITDITVYARMFFVMAYLIYVLGSDVIGGATKVRITSLKDGKSYNTDQTIGSSCSKKPLQDKVTEMIEVKIQNFYNNCFVVKVLQDIEKMFMLEDETKISTMQNNYQEWDSRDNKATVINDDIDSPDQFVVFHEFVTEDHISESYDNSDNDIHLMQSEVETDGLNPTNQTEQHPTVGEHTDDIVKIQDIDAEMILDGNILITPTITKLRKVSYQRSLPTNESLNEVYTAKHTFRLPLGLNALRGFNYWSNTYDYFKHTTMHGSGGYFLSQNQKKKNRKQKRQFVVLKKTVRDEAEKNKEEHIDENAIDIYFEQKWDKDETMLVTDDTVEKNRIFSKVEATGIVGTDMQTGTLKELEMNGIVTIRPSFYGRLEVDLKQKRPVTQRTSRALNFDKFDNADDKIIEEAHLNMSTVKDVLKVCRYEPATKKFTYKWPAMKQNNNADALCRMSSVEAIANISAIKEKQDGCENKNDRANREAEDTVCKEIERFCEHATTRGAQSTTKDTHTESLNADQVKIGGKQLETEEDKSMMAISDVSNESEFSTCRKVAEVIYPKYRDMDLKTKPCKTNPRNEMNNRPIVPSSYKEKVLMLRDLTWRARPLPVPNNQIQIFRVFEPLMTILGQLPTEDPPGPEITMRYELLRVCTLRNYPKHDKPYVIRLAGAGFYYAAEGDEVVCYTCGIRRHDWVEADVPLDIHKRIAPNCRFLTKNDEVNVPVPRAVGPEVNKFAFLDEPGANNVTTAQHNSNRQSEDVSSDVTSSLAEHMGLAPQRQRRPGNFVRDNGQSQVVTANTRMTTVEGVNRVQPKHPDYAIKARRISSFQGWPDNLHQTPEILSDAGFYFAGVGDAVRCFFCGIGLRHWAEEDNPWIEHARWSRHCVYLKQLKGEEFINLVHMAVQYTQENDEQTASTPGTGNQLPTDELDRLLLTDAAQSVLEVGYQPRIIKKAIEIVVREHGRDGFNSQRIIEKVIEIEEAEDAANIANNLQQLQLGNQTSDITLSENTTEAEAEPRKTSQPSAAASAPKHAQASNTREVTRTQQPTNPTSELKAEAAKNPTDQGATGGIRDNKSKKETERYHPDSKSIKAENEKLKEQTVCKICLDNTVCIVFLPCGHLVTCAECAPAMRKCPMCRSLVKGTVKTFMA